MDLMTAFLQTKEDIALKVHGYTSVECMKKNENPDLIEILLISESLYKEELAGLVKTIVILNESGLIRWTDVRNVNKYQSADGVYKDILEVYLENKIGSFERLSKYGQTRLIGIDSPIRTCLQTGFAITMRQLLSKEHPTLYLNFEHYVGITEILPDMQTRDMADLLFFLTAEKEKFRVRMQTMIQKKGTLDYIPPMKSGQNLLGISKDEWLGLMGKIADGGDYEYVVMDLTDSMQGLFDILRSCSNIFTIVQDDKFAECKITQYEHLLSLYKYEDVLKKTKKCHLPKIKRIPDDFEEYTRGEMADYVRLQIEQMENSGQTKS